MHTSNMHFKVCVCVYMHVQVVSIPSWLCQLPSGVTENTSWGCVFGNHKAGGCYWQYEGCQIIGSVQDSVPTLTQPVIMLHLPVAPY